MFARGTVRTLNMSWEPEVMRRTGASDFCFKEVTSKAAVEYGLKRVETGDSKDCEEAEVPKPLGP